MSKDKKDNSRVLMQMLTDKNSSTETSECLQFELQREKPWKDETSLKYNFVVKEDYSFSKIVVVKDTFTFLNKAGIRLSSFYTQKIRSVFEHQKSPCSVTHFLSSIITDVLPRFKFSYVRQCNSFLGCGEDGITQVRASLFNHKFLYYSFSVEDEKKELVVMTALNTGNSGWSRLYAFWDTKDALSNLIDRSYIICTYNEHHCWYSDLFETVWTYCGRAINNDGHGVYQTIPLARMPIIEKSEWKPLAGMFIKDNGSLACPICGEGDLKGVCF